MKNKFVGWGSAIVLAIIVLVGIAGYFLIITTMFGRNYGELYYYQAEIIAQSDGIVTFGGVDVENPQIYVYNAGKELDCDVPYLLTMDNMRTDDVSDDIVVVVWACVN